MSTPDHRLAELLADLNEPQRQAVTHCDGPLLVLAGPGSGKTRVITRRAAHLVHTGVAPRNILAITFTNKAADEMRHRLAALGVGQGMWVYTFHALGVRLLREFGTLGDVQPGFTIYDESDQERVAKTALELCQVHENLLTPSRALWAISAAKNQLLTPELLADRAATFEQRTAARVYKAYEQLLRARNAVDFDDLLMRVACVLRDHPEIGERLNVRFRYVLIDEYQDTNHAQYLIARYLSQHHRNICATGDPDQSIYGWRGADLNNILDFEEDYPDALVVRLEENYRSTPEILTVASRLIAGNRRRKHKDLWTRRPEGAPVHVWEFAEDRDEATRVAETIAAAHRDGRPYRDFAIAYRVNALSRGLEDALRASGVPYRIARGVEFYNRKEIKDTLAYLRVLVNPADEIALLRCINTPPRGIGDTTIQRLRLSAADGRTTLLEAVRGAGANPKVKTAARKLAAFVALLDQLQAAATGGVAEAVSAVLRHTGLERALAETDESQGEDRLANVRELVSAARAYEEDVAEPTLEDFLQRISLTSDQDAIDEMADAVLLLTLHAAKGLEFPVVFIVGLEQGLLPHDRALQENDIEEERRLLFVGITRAREQLYLSHARQRLLRGLLSPRNPSQFVGELPDSATVVERLNRRSGMAGPRRAHAEFELVPDEWSDADVDQRPRRHLRHGDDVNPEDRIIQIAAAEAARSSDSPFAGWQPGEYVRHAAFGLGQIVWITPAPRQTRALIRFPTVGEKVLILEFAKLERLDRRR
jgi:DNA helicase-2/ATP-dependent DNA helicase PcrA